MAAENLKDLYEKTTPFFPSLPSPFIPIIFAF